VRILRLHVDGRREVDLHPHLSVVAGLQPGQAAVLRRAVAAIGCGLAPRGTGLLEAGGLLLDAEQADLDLLDLGATPTEVVVGSAALAGAGSDAELRERLRTAARDVLLLATDRRWAALARDAARLDPAPDARHLVRAERLRAAVAAHEGTDVQPLRAALDADRDARRLGAPADGTAAAVAGALAALGLDLRPHHVEATEVRRTAEDLLDEHRRHEAWAVGARVELAGLEQRLLARRRPAGAVGAATATLLPESGERRLARAEAALADAIARADDLREQARCPAPPDAVVEPVLRLAVDRRREPPAGTVPLLLDRLLDGWSEAEVAGLLARLEPVSRGVQVLVLDDHPAAIAWAHDAGRRRAAVVSPSPAPAR